jgi:hypothetical protein
LAKIEASLKPVLPDRDTTTAGAMHMKSVLRHYLLLLCLISLGIPGYAVQLSHGRPERVYGMSYSIISNNVVSNPDSSYSQRNIFLVMGPQNFTEKRLIKLMKYFLKEYATPESMFVFLYSHDSQLRDLGKLEVTEPNDEFYRHPYAVISRVNRTMELKYTTEKSRVLKTIMVKDSI